MSSSKSPIDLTEIDPADRVSEPSFLSTTKNVVAERAAVETLPESQDYGADGTKSVPSSYLITGLPSQCGVYRLAANEIHLRRLSTADVLKLSDAAEENNLTMVAEVIGQTLWKFPWQQLTVGDFWFIMYWHRLHSYPRHQHRVNWLCKNEKHLKLVKDGEAEASTLQQSLVVSRSNLETVDLNVEAYEGLIEQFEKDHGVQVQPIRMGDYCRVAEMEVEDNHELMTKGKRKHKSSELVLANKACLLGPKHGATLAEKMEFLRTYEDPGLMWDLEDFIRATDHGVTEMFKVSCEKCGASAEVEASVDAHTFLSQL